MTACRELVKSGFRIASNFHLFFRHAQIEKLLTALFTTNQGLAGAEQPFPAAMDYWTSAMQCVNKGRNLAHEPAQYFWQPEAGLLRHDNCFITRNIGGKRAQHGQF